MSHECFVDDIVTTFFLNTCRLHPQLTEHGSQAAAWCAMIATTHPHDDTGGDWIPLITGSAAEFYIEPMLPHVNDIDVMFHYSTQLAIPRGHPPPTQLPAEFSNYVKVYEIVDSHLPGYVYLELRYLLTECTDDDTYRYFTYDCGWYKPHPHHEKRYIHGPAVLQDNSSTSFLSIDGVFCIRCLSLPPQAADWPTRHRHYDWPDSATVDCVVNNGCDVVGVAHRECKHDEWMSKHQFRLSFSRAEIVLLNSWMPLQQIVYHMLRVFVKTEPANSHENSDHNEALNLSNYHIKTLIMWACELKSSSFWTNDLNLIRICVDLFHTLSVWLTDAQCPHYFINNCNLLTTDSSFDVEMVISQLKSIDQAWLSTWFINNYIRECSKLCPDYVSSLFSDVSQHTKLQNAVSAIVDWRLNTALKDMLDELHLAELNIAVMVTHNSLTVRSCICWMTELPKIYTHLTDYFIAVAFLLLCSKYQKLVSLTS